MGDSQDPRSKQDPMRKTDEDRQITYRVGWKSGTIHLGEKKCGSLSQYAVKPVRTKVYMSKAAEQRKMAPTPIERAADWLLQPAPQPSLRAWKIILAALPPVAFAMLCWLAFVLQY